jgi:hypothetical protein
MKKIIILFTALAVTALCFGQPTDQMSVKYKISGSLTYCTFTSTLPLPNNYVYLKDGPEPVPPYFVPVPTILHTAVTDYAGYYEFYVGPGTYYLYAAGNCIWDGVDGIDVIQIRRYIAGLSNSISGIPLRERASDVSMDGVIDGVDVTALRRRLANLTPNPNYKAPDWLYENPVANVTTQNITVNFRGICSAEVDGSLYNPSCSPVTPPPSEVPLTNWALFAGIGLILVYATIRFRKVV